MDRRGERRGGEGEKGRRGEEMIGGGVERKRGEENKTMTRAQP